MQYGSKKGYYQRAPDWFWVAAAVGFLALACLVSFWKGE
jgi:hypothetical protein